MKMMNPVFLKFLQAILVFELCLLAPNSWRATGAIVRCVEREREALLLFKDSLVDNSGRLSSWSSEEDKKDCCEWEGVHCSNRTGHVEMLNLHGDVDEFGEQQSQLQGKIGTSLIKLQHLKYLNLSYNDFGDSHIPDFLGSLSNLRYLDLKSCFFIGKIPSQLGNLSHLRYLDLSKIGLGGVIPYQLGNLSQLQYLDLGENTLVGTIPFQQGNLSSLQKLDLGYNFALEFDHHRGGEWLSSLTSLTQLDLSKVINLNYSHNLFQMIGEFPSLIEVSLSDCSLSDDNILPLKTSKLNVNNTLVVFGLSENTFTSSIIFHWLMNVSSNFVELDLSNNLLKGSIPHEFGNTMSSLERLDLSVNKLINGGIPESFRNICTLRSLTMAYNNLSEELPTILENLSGCARYSLQSLDLSWNQITGTLPDLSIFTSLKTLILSQNLLNGWVPKAIQFPSQLETFSIPSNSLKGVISDSHFANMSKLKTLDFSYNTLALKFEKNWVPTFQLDKIFLRSCKLGPDFPKWLKTQNNFSVLEISDAGISDFVPEWFWDLLTPNLLWLNVSYNNLWGTIPNIPISFIGSPDISLASNQFKGSIPSFLRGASVVDLSNNKFSESLMFTCDNSSAETLAILDVSSNQLSGQLADCWRHFTSLIYLDLSNNNLSNKVPPSIGSLPELQVLIMRNNSLNGDLPFTLKSCTKLLMLDVGENRLSGPIPSWIGDGLQKLQILSLRKNHFSGSLPLHLCYLTGIQLLDLSLNNLSGQIFKCLKNFTAMAQKSLSTDLLSPSYMSNNEGSTHFYQYEINPLLTWKGVQQLFKNSKLLKSIDLSSNQLNGAIPIEIVDLIQLVSLNLSRNNLTEKIPYEIGRLMSLEFLDLSRNNLYGSIPSSVAHIDRLTMLDLSHNHLFGKIPTSTQLQSFNSSSYGENLDLCGKPLEKMCTKEEKPQEPVEFQDEHSFFSKGFYWSMALGFITGFWGIFGSILLNRSWRHAYFRFLNKLTDTIYVMAALNVAKCQRWLKR